MLRSLLFPLLFTPFRASAKTIQQPIDQTPLSKSGECPLPHISCPSSTPSNVDTCCLNHPSGHFLLTQFWDTSPSLGPSDSWTIHGLWPDLCHGGFDQFCDSSRSHSDINSILFSSASPDLLYFMSKYWLSMSGDNNHLWSHEWNKHGTCISTLDSDCYPTPSKDDRDIHKDVVDYFTHAATLFSTLNTYDALAASNIIPTHQRTYDIDDLQSAISTLQGAEVTFRCHGQQLQEIWYHFTVHGSLRDAPLFTNATMPSSSTIASTKHKFRAVGPDGAKSNCPATGIRYIPKQPSHPAPSHTSATSTSATTATSTSTATSVPFSGKGHLIVRPKSTSVTADVKGCLIRSGSWYLTHGSSCANYIAYTDAGHLSPTSWPWPTMAPSPNSSPDIDMDDVLSPITDEEDYTILSHIYAQPLSERNKDNDDSKEHLFTLSSLYSPCAVIPSIYPSEGGLFTCAKNLGMQSIFSSVCDSDSDSDSSISPSSKCESSKYILAHEGSTTFYADHMPEKLEKVSIYGDDKDGERTVELEILWEAL